jgi:cell wall-associated NlpC family hydrolase
MQSIANSVVEKAREYLGTRWHHQGRVKGVGVDCIGLIMCVAYDLGLGDWRGVGGYGRLPTGGRLRTDLSEALDSVPLDEMQPGDILLMRFAGEPQHVALLSTMADGRLGMIHAHAAQRKVVEHGLDAIWKSRIIAVYRFKQGQNP